MKITVHSTDRIIDLIGDITQPGAVVPARVWEGVTESGIKVNLFVTRVVPILPRDDPRQEQFQSELIEHEPPSATASGWPSRLVL